MIPQERPYPAAPTISSHERPILSTTEARQGVLGHGVRYVLAISVAAALVAMVIAWFVA